MDFSRRFDVRLGARLAAFVIATVFLVAVGMRGGMPATVLIAVAAMAGSALAVWSLVRRTNTEVARFVAALHQRDLTQSFAQAGRGGGFGELGRAFDDAVAALRLVRERSVATSNFAGALVDGVPTPLLTIDGEGRVRPANKTARRLFARADGARIDDFAAFGSEFVEALRAATPGRRSTRLVLDGLPQRTMLDTTFVDRGAAAWRIVSVQIIQQELDQAELATQTDLVRVLTHEIMNSMTPLTSLAASAAQLMATIDDGRDPAIGDVRAAIDTLARRAAGTAHFVETFREFARTPTVALGTFDARGWAQELTRLFAASTASPAATGSAGGAIRLDISLPDGAATIHGDVALLTQITLNLLKNAAEAAGGYSDAPRVRLDIAPYANGRTRVVVSDNGPGIPARYAQDVFLPFFTTKRDGTGVGLSFARQIVLLHGGTIGVVPTAMGASIEFVV